MNEVKKVLFIVNKFAGGGYQPQVEGRILDACEKYETECTIEFTRHRGHATELAQSNVDHFNYIVAVGGDGTLNEVARGLVGTSSVMGIIPKGSGNGLARHLGIALDIEGALHNFFTGRTACIDTFRMNGKLSINVSGIGFDGHIANLFSENKKRGFWGYAKLVFKEYLQYPEFSVEITDGERKETYTSFITAIANSTQYGNNAHIAPNASVEDRLLQLVRVKKIPLFSGIPFALNLFLGKLKNNRRYNNTAFHSGKIISPKPVAYHIDGEPCGFDTEFIIEMMSLSLNLVVPG